jgi:hypothetical protein
MDPERWQKIEQLFEAALERGPQERAVFLDRACGDDAELMREVESLLAHRQPTGRFISTLVHDAVKLFPQAKRTGGSETRFIPGTILAGRYRVVGPLGRGGMGEVYRADDLKLGQPVALKFLPDKLTHDAAMLERFHREVRTARKVSHPNVCRVFDIAEAEGLHFLSMEYIDGEDLSSLLRRIGRLPEDKAIEIARQLCAGLAEAHEEGVLHRDLKPANIMIDGRGRARITDFGLAALTDEVHGHEIRSGTPSYMAPEQLAGREVTAKSDIYSLGLLLYEVFTGRRVYNAESFDELIRQQETSEPPSISSYVKDIDPLVERVIQRCLEREPARRPTSAAQVAAALPGGDPLAAAIAAGETPSPEMVAAATKQGALRPWVAIALLATILAALAFRCFGTSELFLYQVAAFEKSPEVLSDRAREVARTLGYQMAPADSDYGFTSNDGYIRYVNERDQSPERWRRFAQNQPAPFYFWYRQSPRPLVPLGSTYVAPDDPPTVAAGMVNLTLDTQGRLLSFDAAPAQVEPEPSGGPAPAPDWRPLFEAAGLDIEGFTATEPRWVPPHNSDARAAWEGRYPNARDIPLRIEAAAFRGKPVYFETIAPWTVALRDEPWDLSPANKRMAVIIFVVFMTVLLTAVWLARRNVRLGRGDRKGAARLGFVIFSLSLLGWLLSADHVAAVVGELRLFWFGVAGALLSAALVWLLYMALEPYLRRRQPELIISWSRLLAGDFRDPMVGRDILIGMFAVALFFNLLLVIELVARRFGLPGDLHGWGTVGFEGLSGVARLFLGRFTFMSLLHGLGYVLLLFLFSLFLRRRWAAGLGLWLLFMLVELAAGTPTLLSVLIGGVAWGLIVFVVARFGLLAMVTVQFCYFLTNYLPYTSDLSAWYAGATVFALLVWLGSGFYAFRTSLGDQQLLRRGLIED